MASETIADPRAFLMRVARKLNTTWLRAAYPFPVFGNGVSIHHSCDIGRNGARFIRIHDNVYLACDVWLNTEAEQQGGEPKIILGKGSKIGRRSTISAKNRVELEQDVLLAPSVLIMDHNHEYSDPTIPIHAQGTTAGGRIFIGRNSWIGYNSVVFCGSGELELGQNTVVGANSVVTKSFPPFSVVAGNPAKLIRRFDPQREKWERVVEESIKVSS